MSVIGLIRKWRTWKNLKISIYYVRNRSDKAVAYMENLQKINLLCPQPADKRSCVSVDMIHHFCRIVQLFPHHRSTFFLLPRKIFRVCLKVINRLHYIDHIH